MNCPRCGTASREGASFCDSCGASLRPRAPWATDEEAPDEPTLLERGGLGSWMAADWLLRFIIVGIIGFVAGLLALAQGVYEYALFFFGLFVVGVVGAWFVARAR